MPYRIAADAVLIVHTAFVAFVVVGLLAIVLGGVRNWRWVRNPWLRLAHFACIAVVVVQSLFGWRCPLTDWENQLRILAGQTPYDSGFIAHWLHSVIFFDLQHWQFMVGYITFAVLVLVTLVLVPPDWSRLIPGQGRGKRKPPVTPNRHQTSDRPAS